MNVKTNQNSICSNKFSSKDKNKSPAPSRKFQNILLKAQIFGGILSTAAKKNTRLVFGRCYSMHSVNSASFGLPLPVRKVQTFKNYSESILHLHFILKLIPVNPNWHEG